ncbi:MAG TPA: glycosyltransferase [Chthoniobacteraceae bacterium]|nr:glycosyltransferase [Chthoniobacteraceae bacterium]
MADETDPARKRILIFIVAYNAEKTITSVLDRIPASLRTKDVEVLVIDDFSKDDTFSKGLAHPNPHTDFKITMLRTPENQGYGGNQKLGYRYAIEHGFDIVALVHGDGQYAPEKLPDLLEPFYKGEADAVFGSRMLRKGDALKGGMPLYKWAGNQILTRFQNSLLGTHLSEFHSGYRLYSVAALRQIPFERNSNDFHFDTEIIIQLVMKKLRIVELPIPTYYGDEICHVNGMKYAWDVCRAMLRSKFHERGLLYDRKYDVGPVEENYDLKLGYTSSHTLAIARVKPGADVLDVGCGRGYVADEFAKTARHVTGVDQYVPSSSANPKVEFFGANLDEGKLPVNVSQYDQIFMLDIIEHLRDPVDFMEKLREATGYKRPEIVLTTANIGFFITRAMLFFGHFNYGRKGILDRTHTRLFTFNSLRELLDETGYKVTEVRGIPGPYPSALGNNWLGRALVHLNAALIHVSKGLFSYQILVVAQAKPTVPNLLSETIGTSDALRKKAVEQGVGAGSG